MPVTAIRHSGIVVSNLDTSLPFYRGFVGAGALVGRD